jgi:hypothetical protein
MINVGGVAERARHDPTLVVGQQPLQGATPTGIAIPAINALFASSNQASDGIAGAATMPVE